METSTMVVDLRRRRSTRCFTTRLLLHVKPVALELPTARARARARASALRTGTTPPTPPPITTAIPTTTMTTTTQIRRRRTVSISIASLFLLQQQQQQQLVPPPSRAGESNGKFSELKDSGGVKALDLRIGDGPSPQDGDEVAIHYYGRLAAKQGWRFDSTYDHKDASGDPLPFVFTLGSGKVIPGIEATVRSMNVGGIRRVIIPPSQGYQSTKQEPIPPNFFDRQRLFTTIFNPTRLANGEGSTLGTLIFDIELVTLRHTHY